MHRSFKSIASEFTNILSTIFVICWASSQGGPGRNLGFDKGVSSTLGTINPWLGVSALGCANSWELIKIRYLFSSENRCF